MTEIEIIVLLLFSIAFLTLLSQRCKAPLPIVLVLTGLIISVIPGLPAISLRCDIIFPIFLPPLLYYTAWNISWCTFKRHLRAIVLASVSLVFFTVFAMGAFIHLLLPTIGWPTAILLSAILSPPDAIAATSLIKGLGIQPRLITILEGESLFNDAGALIAFKYSLSALVAGSFSLGEATREFATVIIGGFLVGIVIAFILCQVQKRLIHQPDVSISITLMLLTPYASYLLAERLHFSGILAVVTTGLYLSLKSDKTLNHQSRIKGYAVWDVMIFILNSLVFVLIGLQLKGILNAFSLTHTLTLLLYSFLIVIAGLFMRFSWTVPNTLLPRMWSRKIREREPFDPRNMFVFTWAGMKGIMSMTIALSLPQILVGKTPFPFRSEIVFLTFFVILLTLLFQGLTFPLLIRNLKLTKYSIQQEEHTVRQFLASQMKEYISKSNSDVTNLARFHLTEKYRMKQALLERNDRRNLDGDVQSAVILFQCKAELTALEKERELAYLLRRQGKVTEEVLHKIEREIDIEEERLRLELCEK